jgi:HAD superfamily hydrolase (TIGR01459 family)
MTDTPPPAVARYSSLSSLIPLYDAFVLDQFGTLHDGGTLYPGVVAVLRAMRAAGKRVAMLSNSGKRAADNAARLTRLGVPEEVFDVVMTSGEVGFALIAAGLVPATLGRRRCLLLERDGDGSLLDGLDLRSVSASDADLVLIAGSEGERRTLGSYAEELAPLARAGVPAVCLNPDRTMLTPRGFAFGAGQIAELYQRLGGAVTWIGKPYAEVFTATLKALGDPPPARVAVVGDSVEHDIAGARAAGCAAWLVRTGIIAGADDTAIAEECRRFGATPDGILEGCG